MAKYFLYVKVFSRGKGSRVTRAAAYRAGERIRDERTSEVYNYRRGEPQAHSVFGQIEPAVVEARADDVIHAAPRSDAGNHLAHEEPRERGVAVGEVVDVGIAFKNPGLWHLQPEPLESRVFATPCEQRRYRLALAREQVERASGEHRERTLVETVVTLQVGAVGGGRQQALFFGGTLAGEHVARVRV